jgi:hypothetical protein
MEGDPSEEGSGMRIYLDLDETLIANVVDSTGNVVQIIPRPGVGWFLRTMAQHGSLWLLTAAHSSHAKRALRKLGPEAKLFKGILTREDMEPIEEQIAVVLKTPGLTDEQRLDLWEEIKPIARPGIMFDDFPVGSSMWAMKSKAIGTSPDEEKWIQVESYFPGKADRQGLKRAYAEFVSRFGNHGAELGRRERALAWL